MKLKALASKLWDVEPRIRDYRPQDFDELWQLDQSCFAPGIAYSRFELMRYIRRRGAFTLVAEDAKGQITGFAVAECQSLPAQSEGGKRRSAGHVITLDVRTEARRTRGGYHSYGCCREPDVGSQLRRGLPGGRGQQPGSYCFLQTSRLQRASDCTAILSW